MALLGGSEFLGTRSGSGKKKKKKEKKIAVRERRLSGKKAGLLKNGV